MLHVTSTCKGIAGKLSNTAMQIQNRRNTNNQNISVIIQLVLLTNVCSLFRIVMFFFFVQKIIHYVSFLSPSL